MQKCEKCSFETGSIIGLSRHLKQKHGIILSTPKNTCSYCKKVFTTSTGCKRHVEKRICLPKEPIPESEEIPVLQSYPVQFEETASDSQKKGSSLVSRLVKVVICSVLFFPFFIKDNKDKSL